MTGPSELPAILTSASFLAALTSLRGNVPLPEADPEIAYFQRIERYLTEDPAEYQRWLDQVSQGRLQSDRSHAELTSMHRHLRGLMETDALSSYACAEAMQVCLSDLLLLEDLEKAELPWRALQILRKELPEQSLDLVSRLVRNIATRLRIADESGGHDQPQAVRLADFPARGPAVVPTEPAEPVLTVLTAGRGTRLRSTIPKGLIPLGGVPMIYRTISAAAASGLSQMIFVLKFRPECQADYLARWGSVITQDQAKGTGHSAFFALSALVSQSGPVLLSFSDQPFLSTESFRRLMAAMYTPETDMVLSTFYPAESDSGRIVRDVNGHVLRVIQPRLGETTGTEGDGGLYAVRRDPFLLALGNVRNSNVRGEFNLPDAVSELNGTAHHVRTVACPPGEFQSVNTPRDLVLAQLRAASAARQGDADVAGFFASRGATGPSPSAIADTGMERVKTLIGPIFDLHPEAP